MNPSQRPGLFVVGTDTGVGKTFISCAITRALREQGKRVGVLKPAATGAARTPDGWSSEDAEALIGACGNQPPHNRVCPIVYEEPLAPCVAARRLGEPLTQAGVEAAVQDCLEWWRPRADVIVVEGVGGLLCPLAEGTTVADLAVWLGYPLVVVARRGLGTLNHVLLTLEAADRRGLAVASLVLSASTPGPSGAAEITNAEELRRRLPGLERILEVPFHAESTLPGDFHAVDWYHQAISLRPTGRN